MTPNKYALISLLACCLFFQVASNAQLLYPNVDFDGGPGGNCQCPTTWTCGGDAGRVDFTYHPTYFPGAQGCLTGQNYLCQFDPVYSPPAAVYFYGGGDTIRSQVANIPTDTIVCMNLKYKGPTVGTSDQDTPACHFSFGIDDVQVGPDIPVPTNLPWTFIQIAVPISAGNHTFSLISGDPGDYAMWFDEYICYTSGCTVQNCDSSWTAINVCPANGPFDLDTLVTGASGGIWTGIGVTGSTFDPSVGSQYITYEAPDSCYSSLTQLITVDGPTDSLSINNVGCNGQSNGTAALHISGGSGNLTYLWSNGSTQDSISGLAAGSYWVEYSDTTLGCTSTIMFDISEPSELSVNLLGVETCLPTPSNINATISGGTTPYSITWSNSPDTLSNINVTSGGWHAISIIDDNGCFTEDSIFLNVYPAPVLNLLSDTSITRESCVFLASSGDSIISWTPDNTLDCTNCYSPLACPDQTTTYCAEIINSDGCLGTECVTITVTIECGDIYVPSAFSPNDDGENDLQCVYSDCLEEFTFKIYNRWGEEIFESKSPSDCWDGFWRGQKLNPAVFVYTLEGTLVTGEEIYKSGNITLFD